jgi:hypothetical protein
MDRIEKLLQQDAKHLRANPERYAALQPGTRSCSSRANIRRNAAALTMVAVSAAAICMILILKMLQPGDARPIPPTITESNKNAETIEQDLLAFQQLAQDTFAWAERVADGNEVNARRVVDVVQQQVQEDRLSMRRILASLSNAATTVAPETAGHDIPDSQSDMPGKTPSGI